MHHSTTISAPFHLRRLLSEVLTIAWVLATCYLLWASLRYVTDSKHPVLVVSSESMEPAFYRGDVIFLSNCQQKIHVGDIPVVWFQNRSLPMVHRAIEVHYAADSVKADSTFRQLVLTKGDNNDVDDRVLYPEGREYAYREEVVGLVKGYVPYAGWLSLIVSDRQWILYLMLGAVALFVR
ncbi:signal peptidase I [Amniculicola lignicola CBS 123094]|uniref:Signal peptidase complex catalytic subunit SEC11 n=1 Tax=Amniculicola lignicola CBS 123094 TaxID=1392246 RepID=A0A6A5W9V2_9PLEO|nr:signal peptidase I [Amniculicola lignicola CBS 123094]